MKLRYLGVMAMCALAGVVIAATTNQNNENTSEPEAPVPEGSVIIDSGGSLSIVDQEKANQMEEQQRQEQLRQQAPRQPESEAPSSFQAPVSGPEQQPTGTPMNPNRANVPNPEQQSASPASSYTVPSAR